ncbi:MAG: hypothetical protein FJW30_00065 [Acidobacteria bacterium]|nr:hypothetical protein [Acidobacteriota bacterium]
MSIALRKLAELAPPRKTVAVETRPYTPEELRGLLPGFPQGGITEITGARSSGRTTMMHAALAAATAAGELCALVDASDAFDPSSAAQNGVDLDRLLWARCHHDTQDALKAADLILHAGGFKLVVLDLCDVRDARGVPVSAWHRLRLAVENTPNVLLVTAAEPVLRQAAAMQIALGGTGRWGTTLMQGLDIAVHIRKPMHAAAGPGMLRALACGG